MKANVLFVCSRNRWRSPTAEAIWRDSNDVSVRARGLSAEAARVVTRADIGWADLILVMEGRHRSRLLEKFGDVVDRHRIHVLDIPDDYQFMDPALMELLQARAQPLMDRVRMHD